MAPPAPSAPPPTCSPLTDDAKEPLRLDVPGERARTLISDARDGWRERSAEEARLLLRAGDKKGYKGGGASYHR